MVKPLAPRNRELNKAFQYPSRRRSAKQALHDDRDRESYSKAFVPRQYNQSQLNGGRQKPVTLPKMPWNIK